MGELHPTLISDLVEFTRQLFLDGATTVLFLVQKPTASWLQRIAQGILTRNQSLPSNISSRCASMQTPDSSTPPAGVRAPSELLAPSVPVTSSDSSPTPSMPPSHEPHSRAVATYDGYHIRLTVYAPDGIQTTILSPRRAMQLARDLIDHALQAAKGL